MGQQRRSFTPEFKQEAVDLCRRTGKSECQVAQELGVSQTALSHWLREATRAAAGPNGFQAAEELKALRREVERLRMERDILKKAAAGSTGESNTGLQYSRWRLKPQCLSRTLIQP
ncbi:MAG TPA: transposase [Nitrospiraceae bacterium]|jgi:transposase|nr:transposase [Nitrospiraceae bacterium]